MATRTVVDRPFQDLGVVDASTGSEVEPDGVSVPAAEAIEEIGDPLGAARGILLALLLASPFWVAVVYWLVW